MNATAANSGHATSRIDCEMEHEALALAGLACLLAMLLLSCALALQTAMLEARLGHCLCHGRLRLRRS
jgi:hypothetical protein